MAKSAPISVSVSFPDGTTATVSREDLEKLKDKRVKDAVRKLGLRPPVKVAAPTIEATTTSEETQTA